MTRYGPMYGPDVTFLGVPPCTLEEPVTYADADVVIIGAPFDGGTSHRPGTRFGPGAIRGTDYLPHDGSRPHLALGVDPLAEMRVADAGDVEMFSGDAERSVRELQAAAAALHAGDFASTPSTHDPLSTRPHQRVDGAPPNAPRPAARPLTRRIRSTCF